MKKLLLILFVFTLFTACGKKEEPKPEPQETKPTISRQELKMKLKQELKKKEEKQVKKVKTPEQVELDKQLLEVIIRSPNLETIKKLLNEGADINAPHLYADYPTSPLYLAIDTGNMELIKFLIEQGADVNFKDYDCGEADCSGNPSSPLIKAVRAGKKEIIKVLLDNKADIDMEVHSGDDLGMTALRAAVESNDKDMIDLLLKSGAKDIVVALARPDLLPILLQNGANINEKILSDTTLVGAAKAQGKPKLVQLFIESGAEDAEKVDKISADYPDTAWANIDKQLALAKEMTDSILIGKLTGYGAVVKVVEKKPEVKEIKEVKKVPSDMPALTKEENLMWAAKEGHMDIVQLLLSQGVSVNAREGTSGDTVLMYAIYGGNVEMVKFLIDKGANVNTKITTTMPGIGKKIDYTALSTAAATGKTEIVKLLIAAGADVNMKVQNASGDSALMAARINGHTEIVQLLKDAGAKE